MITSNKIVSIIVPIYNAEFLLENCLGSILNQTYRDIELILINDGSTDQSGLICDEYAKKDTRVKVIHQENSGPSVSRNSGINAAKGYYIQFVDCDDTIDLDMLKILVNAMDGNTDLAISGYNILNMNQGNVSLQKKVPPIKGDYQKNEFMKSFGEFFKSDFINPLWNKIYNTELINKFKIRFNEDLYRGEDLLFNLKYIKVCNRINIINDQLYNYITFNNIHSITSSFQDDLFENQQILFKSVKSLLIETGCFSGENELFFAKSYIDGMINCIDNLFHSKSNLMSKQRKELIIIIINDRYLRINLKYLKSDTLQKRFVGLLINYKLINSINCFYKIKNLSRHNLGPLFNVLKKLDLK
jgi:glycosyltransferase involved in cell wall biosynthesis